MVGIGLKSLGMPFNWKDNGLVLNVLAFVAWRFCGEHYWAAKPQKRPQSARERGAKPWEKLKPPAGFVAFSIATPYNSF